jgi:hypothetical protein
MTDRFNIKKIIEKESGEEERKQAERGRGAKQGKDTVAAALHSGGVGRG